ncbi:thiamine pyrophosphate-binding protein [Halovivax gelatinilyticus]|uniref:thiamine pyrophosphate-binding protein n=1 Tax=Halovivax gelatinilyticus TaxID=2961597 RepID=UPI0020CA9BBC|nr:thiamine pyrophosphate-binding protein [Halovivax gelatinilyticus]
MQVHAAVVDALVANGVDTVFGIPGKQTLPLNEAIDGREDVRFVMARHETAVTHQAWGYAETSGKTAATVVVPGPGDMNAMNGLKNAYNDCTPLVHVAVETEPEIRGGEGIHETPPETYDTVVKENVLVTQPESTVATLESAIAVAETPPKGPVRVGIPKNFLKMDVALADPPAFQREGPKGAAARDVDAAADLLASADAPVVLAGGGVRAADASVDLEAVATRLDAPVVTTYKGKGTIPADHPLSAGTLSGSAPPALLELLANADGMLAVGTDFDAVATRAWSVDVPDELVHVTLDPDDLATGYEPSVSLLADAADALPAIGGALAERGIAGPNGADETAGARRAEAVRADFHERTESLRDDDRPLTAVRALGLVREALSRETTVAVDAGGFRVWALNAFDAYGPQSYVNPGSWATMGTGLPSGIGAQVANPDDDVVVLTGDGGLMMCIHELHTAVAEGLPITVVVFRNEDYAIISEEAERSYALRPSAYGWSDAPIDFVALAESLGMSGVRAADSDALSDAVTDAVARDEPVLVEVPTDPNEPQASEWLAE